MSRGDIVLIVVIALIPIFFLFPERSPRSNQQGKVAEILSNDEVTEIISLDSDSTGRTLLQCGEGEVEIEYGDGRIRVARSTCPGQICVKTGWISRGNEIISCVPNRLLIRITAAGAGTPDGITF